MTHKLRKAGASSAVDARIVRTGDALRSALLALLERKPLDQITIRDITAEAGVHYATFFRHHPTKEALLDHVAADRIRRLVELTLPVLDRVDSQAAFLALAMHVGEHRMLWTALLTGGAAGAVRAELLRVSREVAADLAPKDGPIPVELAVNCTVGLIVETLAWWLSQPVGSFPPEKVADFLHSLVYSSALRPAG